MRLLSWLSLAALPLLKKSGFIWQKRRSGDAVIGLLRRPLSSKIPRRIVLLPGFGDTPLTWLPLWSGYRNSNFSELVFLEYPGHPGFLTRSPAISTMDQLQECVFDVLDSLQPEVVIGHSLGGWMASAYAVECEAGRRPRVPHSKYKGPAHLILISPSGHFKRPDELDAWGAIFKNASSEGGFKEFQKRLFAKPKPWLKFGEAEFKRFFSNPLVNNFIHSIGEEHFVTHSVGKVSAKVDLIWGAEDKINYAHWVHDWVDAFQKYDQVVEPFILESVGHCPHVESPLKTAKILRKILNQIS